jgi:tRNA A-37 threonylcarbamoyl transferase component Bud32
VDRACNEFEFAWRRGGPRPRPEDFLAGWEGPERLALLRELVQLEVDYRRADGENCRAEEYQARFPELGRDWVAEALATSLPVLPPLPSGAPVAGVKSLGDYEVLGVVGRGGMGVVYRGHDPRLKREVALKMVRVASISSEARARLRLEAEAMARLRHPHIVHVHALVEHDGQPVLVLEYVPGDTLEGRLEQTGRLPPAEAARLVAILARAVEAAHRAGITHRDLKPANVLMAPPVEGNSGTVAGGFPKVTDFGLARLADAPAGQTASGAVVGTPSYMAPEQAHGKRDVGPPADVWALGVILYRCLAGGLPFEGDGTFEVLQRICTEAPPPLHNRAEALPEGLEQLCLACLERDPGGRPSAGELAERLEQLASGGRPGTLLRRPRTRRGWLPAAAVAAAAVVAGLLGGRAVLGLRKSPPPPTVEQGSRLEGTYRRSYDDGALGVGKNDRITFSAAGRFEERGFLNAALGSQILPDGRVVFYPPQAGGQGAYRVVGPTLELTYTSNTYGGLVPNGGVVLMRFHSFPAGGGAGPLPSMILNTRYTFVRVGGGAG